MVAVPPDTPNTTPELPTEAIAGADDDQMPPGAGSVRVTDVPVQNEEGPVMGAGRAITVTVLEVLHPGPIE